MLVLALSLVLSLALVLALSLMLVLALSLALALALSLALALEIRATWRNFRYPIFCLFIYLFIIISFVFFQGVCATQLFPSLLPNPLPRGATGDRIHNNSEFFGLRQEMQDRIPGMCVNLSM